MEGGKFWSLFIKKHYKIFYISLLGVCRCVNEDGRLRGAAEQIDDLIGGQNGVMSKIDRVSEGT